MKRLICLLVCLLLPTIITVADNIPTIGVWEEDGISRQSFAPARPLADINGSILSIISPDALSDLNVTITDYDGIIIFQQSYSFAAGEEIELPVSLQDGEYILVMTHYWRYLMGEFEVK